MNEILEFSEELAYVRIQPGVTFQQLSNFLDKRGSQLQMDATAGPQDGSLIGNALERGRSHGPGMATARPVGDFTVVLADARVINTGSRRFPLAAHSAAEPFPVGPDATGLFFESNVGVVTEMTLWLTRKPKDTRVLRLGLPDQKALHRVIVPIRELMLEGVLSQQSVLMINETRWRHEANFSEYTSNRHGEQLPLWPQLDLAWLCTAAVYAADSIVGERRLEMVKDALCPYASVVHESTLTDVGANPDPEYRSNPLWRKKTQDVADPDRDRIGYIFIAPVAPAIPDEISYVYETTRDMVRGDGFEPFINIRFWDARSVVFVGSIVYDRNEAGADERAIQCYKRIMDTLSREGYLPYRLPTFAMQSLPRPVDDWGSFWGDIKRVLDPHDILTPGRYDFRYCWPDNFGG